MAFSVNQSVRWRSSNKNKVGTVVAIVPPNAHPQRMGYNVGKDSLCRDKTSYIVRGNVEGGRPTLYWPVTSLLHASEGLTPDEVQWCHDHAEVVRIFMQSNVTSVNLKK